MLGTDTQTHTVHDHLQATQSETQTTDRQRTDRYSHMTVFMQAQDQTHTTDRGQTDTQTQSHDSIHAGTESDSYKRQMDRGQTHSKHEVENSNLDTFLVK